MNGWASSITACSGYTDALAGAAGAMIRNLAGPIPGMPTLHRVLLAVLLGCCCAVPALAATPAGTIEPPGELFGAATLPSPALAIEVIGSAKGCLAGGVALPENAPAGR
ncbi:MAG: hypothetical protein U1E17_09125 [Geminicoccaceae bacterium]